MDTNFIPSNYQRAILTELKYEKTNILVDAKAGSGKTSTLLLIAKEIQKQNKSCLFLSFNKAIVEELQTKLMDTDKVMVKTLHSLGFSFLCSYLYRKHNTNYKLNVFQHDENIKDKVTLLFSKYCEESFLQSEEVKELNDKDIKDIRNALIHEITQMVNYVRLYNINNTEINQVIHLGTKLCWYLKQYKNYGLQQYPIIIQQTISYIKQSFENPEIINGVPTYNIGYTDMIYIPSYYNMYVPSTIKPYLDYVLCDECQDLSVLQQLFIKKLGTPTNRFIFVGDEKQAIYGFAGADTKSIKNLKNNFQLTELPLNICYRCPENVIKITQSIVPSIDWNHNRSDKGEVLFVKEENLKNIVKPGDVIIGRRNQDLLRIYKEFTFKHNISIKFKNSDMVENIIKEINRVIKEYIRRYNQYLNVEKQLYEKLLSEDIDITQPFIYQIKDKLTIIDATYNALVKQNKLKHNKNTIRKNYTVKYLQTCMQEFKTQGDYYYSIPGSVNAIYTDYFDIIYYFLEQYCKTNPDKTLQDFVTYLQVYLKGNLSGNSPILSSIHMMKGGEADNVYILDYPRFPYAYDSQPEDVKQQEINLQYVALTRAKKNLYLCEISKLRPNETEMDIQQKNIECTLKTMGLINNT